MKSQTNKMTSLNNGIQSASVEMQSGNCIGPAVLPARVIESIQNQKYADACAALRALSPSPMVSETLSVCLMRSGRTEEALVILRSLALSPGTTTLRKTASDLTRLNFAMALTMKGLPSGGVEILSELRDRDSVPAVRLRGAISNWMDGLSFWRRLDWRLNRIDPPNTVVPLDFEPGVLPLTIEAGEMITDGPPTPPLASPELAAQ